MQLVSATDVAIAIAIKANTLRVLQRTGRFGEFIAIEDDAGVIEVQNSMSEAESRIDAIRSAIA